MRWHQQVARTIESVHSRRLDEYAADLAEHFVHSTDAGDLAKAVAYGEMAADQAMRVHASGQAEYLLRQALLAQDVLDPDDTVKRCDLLLKLGESLLPQEQPARRRCGVTSVCARRGEWRSLRSARAAVQALEALERVPPGTSTADAAAWVARADRYARDGTAERVYADLYLAMYSFEYVGPAQGSCAPAHGARTRHRPE